MGNKELEKKHLGCFKLLCLDFPQGEITDGDEPPDFFIVTPDGLLGIEHTEYLRPRAPGRRPLQEQEELRRRILAKAQELYEQAGLPVAHVTIQWMDKTDLFTRDVKPLVEQALLVVKANLPGENQQVKLNAYVRGVRVLPTDMATLDIWRPTLKQSFFSCTEGEWVRELCVEEVTAILDEKAPSLTIARQKVKKLWLLIVADGGRPSRITTITDTLKRHAFSFCCDRAFILQRAEGSLVELCKATPTA